MANPYILNRLNLSEATLKAACQYDILNHATEINTQATGTEYLMDVTTLQKMGSEDSGLLIGSFILVISKGNAKIEIDEEDTAISYDHVIAKICEVILPSELHVV